MRNDVCFVNNQLWILSFCWVFVFIYIFISLPSHYLLINIAKIKLGNDKVCSIDEGDACARWERFKQSQFPLESTNLAIVYIVEKKYEGSCRITLHQHIFEFLFATIRMKMNRSTNIPNNFIDTVRTNIRI